MFDQPNRLFETHSIVMKYFCSDVACKSSLFGTDLHKCHIIVSNDHSH